MTKPYFAQPDEPAAIARSRAEALARGPQRIVGWG